MVGALIAVIDDDESVRMATKLMVESFGDQATVFESAENFLRSERVKDASCLVLDFQMRGMNGLQLQRHLAAEGFRIPIIFISGLAEQEHVSEQCKLALSRF